MWCVLDLLMTLLHNLHNWCFILIIVTTHSPPFYVCIQPRASNSKHFRTLYLMYSYKSVCMFVCSFSNSSIFPDRWARAKGIHTHKSVSTKVRQWQANTHIYRYVYIYTYTFCTYISVRKTFLFNKTRLDHTEPMHFFPLFFCSSVFRPHFSSRWLDTAGLQLHMRGLQQVQLKWLSARTFKHFPYFHIYTQTPTLRHLKACMQTDRHPETRSSSSSVCLCHIHQSALNCSSASPLFRKKKKIIKKYRIFLLCLLPRQLVLDPPEFWWSQKDGWEERNGRGWRERVEAANKKNGWMVWKVEGEDGKKKAERAELERKRRGDWGGEESRKAFTDISHSVSLARGCCATIFHWLLKARGFCCYQPTSKIT